MPKPLLIVSDAPTSPTGLGKITGDLAKRISWSLKDDFRVGVAGYKGTYSRHLGYPIYPFSSLDNWAIRDLPAIWDDFAGEEPGILFFIWNASWLPWVTHPHTIPDSLLDLRNFLHTADIQKWIYAPIDSYGPNAKLVETEKLVLRRFDRVLAYTEFGARVIERTLDMKEGAIYSLPHGTDTDEFKPFPRSEARKHIAGITKGVGAPIPEDVLLIGCVATNTARKDWGLCFEVCGELVRRGWNVGLWAHTDSFQKNWDLLSLANEFGMKDRVILSNRKLTDEQMAMCYSACDLTLGIGSEGWGLPISESLACGVPCITGNYAGATDFTPDMFLVEPVAFRHEGFYANQRPVFDAMDWVGKIVENYKPSGIKRQSLLDRRFEWGTCWAAWEKWLLEGLNGTDPISAKESSETAATN